MVSSVGRRFLDAKQKLKGRQPLRFQLELIPYFAEGVPSNIKKASFLWQRGPKLQVTDLVEKATDGIVHWDQVLKQTSTMYRDGNDFAQKEYSFKLQGVKGEGKDEKPTTFAKTQIDLAAYCSCETSGTRELIVELRPSGRLHVGVVATWLKNSAPEQDSLTDLSYLSLGPSGPSSTLTGDQDLSGFDENSTALKALHGSPQKRVAFSQSLSMPAPRRTAAAGPSTADRGLRSAKSFAPSLGSDTVLGTPALQRTSMPPLQVDTPKSFAGFQTIPLEENELITPTIPRKTRGDLRVNLHHRSKSEPVTPDAFMSIPEDELCTPTERRSADLEEAYSTLLSSESEDEAAGPVASVRRWWTGKKPKRPHSELYSPRAEDAQAAATAAELEAIYRETDVDSLRARCKALMEERNAALRQCTQLQHKVLCMDRNVESLELAKRGMQDRLAVSEDRLMRLTRNDTMTSLVQAKLKLAQTDYSNLELQARPFPSYLTALIPAHRAFHEDQDGPVIMSCLTFGSGGSGRPKQLPTAASLPARPTAPSPSLPEPGDSTGGSGELNEVAGAEVAVNGGLMERAEMVVLPVSTAISVA
ncbi:hypothetical protein WJX75_005200 [Coccomyxa subellipsoidea]|uniref:C2 NT-type domain-containing protein n=1 Tax=Coccomyxa subellipsoidea TaxID=248742 RepID=A0ABR2YEE0_9CHLO